MNKKQALLCLLLQLCSSAPLLSGNADPTDSLLARHSLQKGHALLKTTSYDSALFHFQKAEEIYYNLTVKYPHYWDEYIHSQTYLANTLILLKRYVPADSVVRLALHAGAKHLDSESGAIATIYQTLGSILLNRSKLDSSLFYNNKALSIFQKQSKPDTLQMVRCLIGIGNVQFSKGEPGPARQTHQQALEMLLTLNAGTTIQASNLYYSLGLCSNKLGEYDRALGHFYQSLQIRKNLLGEKHYRIYECLDQIGSTNYFKGEYDLAYDYYRQSAALLDTSGRHRSEYASLLNNYAMIYYEKGHFEKAIACYEQSLSIKKQILGPQHYSIANTYSNLGLAYQALKDYPRSLDYMRQALDLRIKLFGEQHPEVARCYSRMGIVYNLIEDYDKALDFGFRAEAIILNKLNARHPELGSTYRVISQAFAQKGEKEKALDYARKALSVDIASFGGHHRFIADSYSTMARALQAQGHMDEAETCYHTGHEIMLKQFPETSYALAKSFTEMGEISRLKGDYDAAESHYRQSIRNLYDSMGPKNARTTAPWTGLCEVYLQQNNYSQAFACAQQALIDLAPNFSDTSRFANPDPQDVLNDYSFLSALILKAKVLRGMHDHQSHALEDLKASVNTCHLASNQVDETVKGISSEESSLLFYQRMTNLYDLAVSSALALYQLTGDENDQRLAFTFAERAKANILERSLHESNARRYAHIPDSVLYAEKELRIERAFLENSLDREHELGKTDSIKIKNLQEKIFHTRLALEKLLQQIEKEYPDYFNLKYQTETVEVTDAQKYLAPHSAIISYYTSGDSAVAFVIKKNDFAIVSLPLDTSLTEVADSYLRAIKKVETESFILAADALHALLIRPLQAKIADCTHLVIIPHGALHKIPFEAFLSEQPDLKTPPRWTDLRYLVKKYLITYHYSVTLYTQGLRTQSLLAAQKRSHSGSFLGFAPIFSDSTTAGYVRSVPPSVLAYQSDDEATRGITLDGRHFTMLKESEKEVDDIMDLFAKHQQAAIAYFNGDASEEMFKQHCGSYDLIHVATHGVVNQTHPGLSALIFSQIQDSTNREDGILYAGETYNLDLQADLVVLGSCESGVGRLQESEGMMALTRGFLYSGAANVLVSLWKVIDRPTSELMVTFYDHILAGESYCHALRQAKLQLVRKPATAYPKMWSGFVLIGR